MNTPKSLVVRESDIDGLLAKVADKKHAKYLLRADIKKLRGISDQLIYFDFPVTALIGVNGGGKTTVLGAAGLAYIGVEPKTFFARGGKYDPEMKEWKVSFEYLDRPTTPNPASTSASYKTSKWDRKRLERQTIVFGVSRTVPANERKELTKCSSGKFSVPASRVEELNSVVKEHAGRILGKDLSGFSVLNVDEKGDVTLLTGRVKNNIQYSEFHFGAGESSVIKIVLEIEASDDYSLILIEEIENGLHPVATRKLVEYLVDVARRKNIQAIFTTHSDFAIEPLPHKAIWSVVDGQLRQGKLSIESLRALTGKIEKDGAIFVEDNFANILVSAIFRQHDPELLQKVEIHSMKGDSIAVNTCREHRKNPAIKTGAACILDGDAFPTEDLPNGIMKLPGNAPEIEVYGKVMEAWDVVGGRLTVSLHQNPDKQSWVKSSLEKVRQEVGDHHLLFARAAEALNFLPTNTVEQAFCNIYAQAMEEECRKIISQVKDALRPSAVPER